VPSSAAARPRAVQRALGTRRRLGRARRRKHQRRRGRGRPREARAAAHIIRIVPVDVPSKADQPRELRLLAVPCGLVHGLLGSGSGSGGLLGLGGKEPAHVFSAVSAAREGRPTSFPDTQSERNRQAPEAPKVRSMTSSTRALQRAPAGLPSWPQGPARTPDEGQR
jgi:hypothetical protein